MMPRIVHTAFSILAMLALAGCAHTTDETWGLGKTRLAAAPAKAAVPEPAPPVPDAAPAASSAPVPLAPVTATALPVDPPAPVAVAAPQPVPDTATPEQRAAILAGKARSAGDSLTASSLYRQILASQPDDLDAQLGLAHALLDAGDIDGAKPIAARVFEHAPRNDRVLALMARVDIADGDLSTAAGRLALADSLTPGSRDVGLARGVFEDMRGDHLAAQRAYRQALAATPDDVALQTDLALSLTASGDLNGAAQILEPLAKAADAPASVRHNLALVYGLLDREGEARALLADLSESAVDSDVKFYRWLRLRRLPATQPDSMMPVARSQTAPFMPPRS
jgi:Flp pilus assembly protein TadD